MMVLVIKLSSFAWSAHDGTRSDDHLSESQRSKAIRSLPGLIEYFGYVFFFAGFLVGPAVGFMDYRRFTTQVPPFDKVPHHAIATLKTFASAIVSLYVFVTFGSTYSYNRILEPTFLDWPFWRRFVFLNVAGLMARTKYYIAWKLAESACILTGIGWNGYQQPTPHPLRPAESTQPVAKWDRVQNVAIRKFELGPNPKMMIDSWNKNTGSWLRDCVYVRIVEAFEKRHKQGKSKGRLGSGRSLASLATFGTSAFWHGFYPGYYLTFLTASLLNILSRSLRKTLRPLFLHPSTLSPYKPAYDILAWFLSLATINYLAAPFVVLEWQKSLEVWKRVGYFGHWLVVGGVVVWKVLGVGVWVRWGVGWLVGAEGLVMEGVEGMDGVSDEDVVTEVVDGMVEGVRLVHRREGKDE
ncbi:lysophospholipid acyltransferase [Rhizophlyctis rosea]|nr:lysophospholipid acyltransferase [Rhizophlyctis rosea]